MLGGLLGLFTNEMSKSSCLVGTEEELQLRTWCILLLKSKILSYEESPISKRIFEIFGSDMFNLLSLLSSELIKSVE